MDGTGIFFFSINHQKRIDKIINIKMNIFTKSLIWGLSNLLNLKLENASAYPLNKIIIKAHKPSMVYFGKLHLT